MIQEKITQICQKIGTEVQLLAVSKGQPIEVIQEALNAGQRLFGESRVQEAEEKFDSLRESYPDIELHMIGPLQTNKAGRAVALFDVIQTLDRPKLAAIVAQEIKKQGQKGRKPPRLYCQVNIGQETQKAGIATEKVGVFLEQCLQKEGLEVEGLMAIPPRGQDPVPYFRQMKMLTDDLSLAKLSLGMSGDFEQAAQCGATMVRVGRGVFG